MAYNKTLKLLFLPGVEDEVDEGHCTARMLKLARGLEAVPLSSQIQSQDSWQFYDDFLQLHKYL
jgi:hypothetical protein